jgi:hypothetical protein
MPPRKNPNIESITEEYIDGAVKVHVKASEVPPRQNLNISFADADKLGDEVTLSNQEAYEESHGKIYEMTHNNTVPWRNWAFYMILVSMLTVCFTFAKYASFASGDAQAAVASFNVSVTGSAAADTNVTATVDSNPTDSQDGSINIVFNEGSNGSSTATITFTITNNSDVTIKVASVTLSPTQTMRHSYRFIGPANNAGQNMQTLTTSDFAVSNDNGYISAGGQPKTFSLVVDKAENVTSDTKDENISMVIKVEQVD